MRIIVAISGATGSIYGIRLLETLNAIGVETHLIISKWGERNIELETDYKLEDVCNMASFVYAYDDQAAAISSGSFRHDGMVILPCSMKTLAAIAHGYADNLIARAADVTMKENRKLILSVREVPLSPIHLENMLTLARVGVRIVPPMPAFYNHPKTVSDMIDHHISRILDQLDLENDLTQRWKGPGL